MTEIIRQGFIAIDKGCEPFFETAASSEIKSWNKLTKFADEHAHILRANGWRIVEFCLRVDSRELEKKIRIGP